MATDLSTDTRVLFNQSFFNVLCSDLGSLLLSRAGGEDATGAFGQNEKPGSQQRHGRILHDLREGGRAARWPSGPTGCLRRGMARTTPGFMRVLAAGTDHERGVDATASARLQVIGSAKAAPSFGAHRKPTSVIRTSLR